MAKQTVLNTDKTLILFDGTDIIDSIQFEPCNSLNIKVSILLAKHNLPLSTPFTVQFHSTIIVVKFS